ncbi:MAG: hypothetical protein ABI639_09105 [Thermoanaerobaculia bacterium]
MPARRPLSGLDATSAANSPAHASADSSPSAHSDARDAAIWALATLTILGLIPIGFVSIDGLGHSHEFADGRWSLNPNHLLFEILGAGWQGLWATIAPARAGVDALKLLSALAGALAVGIFRWRVIPQLGIGRWPANYATAWVAFSSAFLRLWVSDETHMIQMPVVVALAAQGLALYARPTFRRGLKTGLLVGIAALTFISNALLGVALALALLGARHGAPSRRQRLAAIAGIAGTALLVTVPALFLAASITAGATGATGESRLSWLSHGRLGTSAAMPRGESGYGLELTPHGAAEALMRATYGSASALVDLTPLAAAVRDRTAPSLRVLLGAAAFLSAAAGVLFALFFIRRADPSSAEGRARRLIVTFTVAILFFGFCWSNSDDQFYFQLAPVFGLLAGLAVSTGSRARRRLCLSLGLAGLLSNVIDVTSTRILYPRAQRVAELSAATAGACLVVLPGFDEAELIFALAPAAATIPHVAITDLATAGIASAGLERLLARIEDCSARRGRVVFVDIFDTPLARNPWKYLRRLGYEHAAVADRLAPFAGESTTEFGPFSVRNSR